MLMYNKKKLTITKVKPEIRRCLVDDSRIADKYHLWSAKTGKRVPWPKTFGISGGWDQQCPEHGGKNTVQAAISVGIPLFDAQLCAKKK